MRQVCFYSENMGRSTVMVDAEQVEAVLNNGVGDSMLCMKSGDRLYIPEPVDVVLMMIGWKTREQLRVDKETRESYLSYVQKPMERKPGYGKDEMPLPDVNRTSGKPTPAIWERPKEDDDIPF